MQVVFDYEKRFYNKTTSGRFYS